MTPQEAGQIITDIHGLNSKGEPDCKAFAKANGISYSSVRYAVTGRPGNNTGRPVQAILRLAHRIHQLKQILSKHGLVIK